jgi:hypothetical protein
VARRISERRLVDVLVAHLRKSYVVGREVPHYEKRIDVAITIEGTGELWAIEAKTTKWAKAIAQAVVNLAAADRSYVAMYAPAVKNVPPLLLKQYGLGLISVGTRWDDVQIVLEAPRSPYCNPLARNRLCAHITEGLRQ